MTGETTPAAARELIDRSQYMTLATADGEGSPWVSPVWFAHEGYAEFSWVSRPEARHSLNIGARPLVALVIFDSTAAPADAQAVYVEAKAEQVAEREVERVLETYSSKSLQSGLPAWGVADVTGNARHRLYRAQTLASFVLAANDRRVPMSLEE